MILLLPGQLQAAPFDRYLWVDVRINEVDKGVVLAALPDGPTPWLEISTLAAWDLLDHSSHLVKRIEDVDFVALDTIAGLHYEFEPQQARLLIRLDPSLLPHHRLNTAEARAARQIARGHGVHLNYDLLHASADGLGQTSQSGFAEIVYHTPWGALRSGWRGQELDGSWRSPRLDTVWTQDFIARGTRLMIGDFISATDSLGTRYRLGGLRYKREFSLRPEVSTFDAPEFSGLAELPSNVELIINGFRRASLQTEPGYFTIEDAPIMTGSGTAEIVLTNVLGERQVQRLEYYVDPRLLREGLHDFDFSIGWQRQQFGISSLDYAMPTALARHRAGINNHATLEWNAAWSRDLANAELQYLFQPMDWPVTVNTGAGLFRTAAAGTAPLARLGVSFQKRRYYAGLQGLIMRRSPSVSSLPLSRQFLSRAGFQWHGWSLAYDGLHRDAPTRGRFERHTVRASRSLNWREAQISFSVSGFRMQAAGEEDESGIQLSLNWTARPRQHWTLTARQAQTQRVVGTYNFRSASELGQKLSLQQLYEEREHAMLAQWQYSDPRWQLRARSRIDEEAESLQLGLQGAIGYLGGYWFVSRPLGSSYALADVGGHANIPVYMHHRQVGITNSAGVAVIPRLLPYQDNAVTIRAEDFSWQTQVLEQSLRLKPGAQTGVYLEFPVKTGLAVQLRLLQAPGLPVPAGAVIYPDSAQEGLRFFSGEDGESYVEIEAGVNGFQAYWDGQSCRFEIDSAELPQQVMPHIGARLCR